MSNDFVGCTFWLFLEKRIVDFTFCAIDCTVYISFKERV